MLSCIAATKEPRVPFAFNAGEVHSARKTILICWPFQIGAILNQSQQHEHSAEAIHFKRNIRSLKMRKLVIAAATAVVLGIATTAIGAQ